MTALTATAIAAVRARFGDDADAVLALRAAHKTVRPYGDGYAVDEVPVDSAELQRMADAVIARSNTRAKRTKQKTAGLGNPSAGKSAGTTDRPDGPGSALADNSEINPGAGETGIAKPAGQVSPTGGASSAAGPKQDVTSCTSPSDDAPHADRQEPPATSAPAVGASAVPIPATCACSRPRGHGGRCWHMRGMPGPTFKRRPPEKGTCAGCTGPLSRSAAGDLCRKCVLAKHRKSSGIPARLAAIEARQEAFEAKVKVAVAELCAHLGLGQGR